MVEPFAHRYGQLQAAVLDELGNLPARDRADSKPRALVALNVGFIRGWQLVVIVNLPDPDMRVEHDHIVASQSESATGLVGSIYVIGMPRNG